MYPIHLTTRLWLIRYYFHWSQNAHSCIVVQAIPCVLGGISDPSTGPTLRLPCCLQCDIGDRFCDLRHSSSLSESCQYIPAVFCYVCTSYAPFFSADLPATTVNFLFPISFWFPFCNLPVQLHALRCTSGQTKKEGLGEHDTPAGSCVFACFGSAHPAVLERMHWQ